MKTKIEPSANRLRFRAWNSKDKIMIEDTGVPHTAYRGDADLQNHIYMQSTGLTDKNGKEIFEGDVFLWSFATDNYKGAVEWHQKRAGFGLPSMIANGRSGFMMLDESVANEGKVIGNIYQNPSLLPK